MRIPLLLALVQCFGASAVLSPLNALAQPWMEEVRELRGIPLGGDFFSLYKECPKRSASVLRTEDYWPNYAKDYPPEFKDVPCYKLVQQRPILEGTKNFEIDNLLFIQGAGRTARVTLIDDRIESIEVQFLNSNREQFHSAMLDKYGRPTRATTDQYQNARGQVFSGRSLLWEGASTMLLYDEYQPGNRDWGYIRMLSLNFQARIDEWQRSRRDNIRRGL